LLALLLVFREEIDGFRVGAVAVIGIASTDTIYLDGGVDGKYGIEEG